MKLGERVPRLSLPQANNTEDFDARKHLSRTPRLGLSANGGTLKHKKWFCKWYWRNHRICWHTIFGHQTVWDQQPRHCIAQIEDFFLGGSKPASITTPQRNDKHRRCQNRQHDFAWNPFHIKKKNTRNLSLVGNEPIHFRGQEGFKNGAKGLEDYLRSVWFFPSCSFTT